MRCALVGASVCVLLFVSTLRAAGGEAANVRGLDLLSNGKWQDAAAAFAEATQADDENAQYHLNLGVALTLAGDARGSKTAITRAGKLSPKDPDIITWTFARRMIFEPSAFNGQPPYKATPYAGKLCDNAVFLGPDEHPDNQKRARAEIEKITKQFAFNKLGTQGATAIESRAEAMYRDGRYQECLDLIAKLRSAGGLDWKVLIVSARCKLAIGDMQGARDEFTQVLRVSPLMADCLAGRAKTEVALGSMRDARDDYALAKQIDAGVAEATFPDAEKSLSTDAPAAESAAELWRALKESAAAGKSDDELAGIAGRLQHARGSGRYIRDEEYTREFARICLIARADPKSADAKVDIARFLINPTVVRKVSLPGVDATGGIPLGAADTRRAYAQLDDALKLEPGNARAMEQVALMYLADNKSNEAIKWVEKALAAGLNSVDLSTMYLSYYQGVAANMDGQAAMLRTPRTWTEDRREGDMIVTYRHTVNPTAADLARAAEIERQAAELRTKSAVPMQQLAGSLEKGTTPKEKYDYRLALANWNRWTGRFREGVAEAQRALEIDPYGLDAITFLIDLCPKVNMPQLAVQKQDLLNNMANPSSGRTLDKIWPQLKQTRFSGAKEQLAAAEQIDPGSPHIACANFAIAQEQGKLQDAMLASRVLLAMESARVTGNSRTLEDKAKTPLTGTDVIVACYVRAALARMLDDAGQFDDALVESARAIRLAVRVPPEEWKVAIPETIKPNDPKALGNDLRSLYVFSNKLAAYKLLAKEDYDQATSHVLALASLEPPDPGVSSIGYDIYRARGWGAFGGRLPDGYKRMWDMEARKRALDQEFGRTTGPDPGAEVAAIDKQIEQINRQIARGVGPDELREVEAKRDELVEKREQLSNARPRRRGG